MGQPDLSLKLVEQVLPINGNGNYIYGMLAFPLLELGRIEDVEEAGKKGYEINKDDSWSQHAICLPVFIFFYSIYSTKFGSHHHLSTFHLFLKEHLV